MNLQIVHTQKPHWGWPKKISFGRFSAGWGNSYFRYLNFHLKIFINKLIDWYISAGILETKLAVYYFVNHGNQYGKIQDFWDNSIYPFNTSYLTDSYIIFTLKMESVSKNTIFGLL